VGIDREKIKWNGWGWAAHRHPIAGREDVWNWLAQQLGMPSLLATPARPLDSITLPVSRLSPGLFAEFGQLLGPERVRDGTHERAFHARGKSYQDLLRLRAGDFSAIPDVVLYPRESNEVTAILSIAERNGIAIVPFGGGTSVVGGVTAHAENFANLATIDLSGLDRIFEIDVPGHSVHVEAGIYGQVLEKALAAKGLTLGHFPQSFEFSTLGGWIAHRGAGQQSSRYGRPKDWLLRARMATPRGMLESEPFSSSATGPRLTDLMLGSEGALGIITDATIAVRSLPKQSMWRAWFFRDFPSGLTAIRRAQQDEIAVSMLRLSDPQETQFYRALSEAGKSGHVGSRVAKTYLTARGIDEQACVLIACFEGSNRRVATDAAAFQTLARSLGALSLGSRPAERWRAERFQAPYLRDPMLDRGVGVETLETAAAWPQLENLYRSVRTALETAMRETAPYPAARGIVLCHVSHAYPEGASLYFTCIFPRNLDAEVAQWQAIKRSATDAIAANRGALSHHHGIGEDHLPWLAQEKGALGLDVLQAIKRTLDPKGILNPGKLIPR
jgi:alkyldihydroxyacetonephosphate synthase